MNPLRSLAYRLNHRYVYRANVDRRHVRTLSVLYVVAYNGLWSLLWLLAGVLTVAVLLLVAGALAYGMGLS